jgi:hypothetical protein
MYIFLDIDGVLNRRENWDHPYTLNKKKGGMAMLEQVLEVFTKEYREEAEYQEWARAHLSRFKLKGGTEDAEEKLRLLAEEGFASDFRVKMDEH